MRHRKREREKERKREREKERKREREKERKREREKDVIINFVRKKNFFLSITWFCAVF